MRSSCIAAVLLAFVSATGAQEKKKDDKPGKAPENVRLALNTGGHSSPVRDLGFTPDGRKLVTLEAREVHLWDMATGERERTWRLPAYGLAKLALSPDGRTVAVASDVMWSAERQNRWVEIWLLTLSDGATHKIEEDIGHGVYSLQFSPDSKRLAWCSEYHAGVMDHLFKNGRVTHLISDKLEIMPQQVRFNSDGSKLLLGGRFLVPQLQVFDVTPPKGIAKTANLKKPLFQLEEASRKWGEQLWQAEWAPDDSRFVAWDQAPFALRLWSADGKRQRTPKDKPRLIPFQKNGGSMNYLQFTDADNVLAVGVAGSDSLVADVINLKSGKTTSRHTFPFKLQEENLRVAGTADGKYLAVTSGPGFQVFVCDLTSDKVRHRLGKPHGAPEAIAWGPDSRSIAWSFKYSDKEEKWQWAKGLNLATLEPLPHDHVQTFRMGRKYPKGRSAKTEEAAERKDKHIGVTLMHEGKRIETKVQSPLGGAIFFEDEGQPRVVVRQHWHENLHILDANTGAILHSDVTWGHRFSVSPDDKFMMVVKGEQTIEVYRIQGKPARLLTVLVHGHEWIAWTPQGYYASSLGGEHLMGWTIRKDFDTPLEFHAIDQFRKQLQRPDIIAKVLDMAGVLPAIKAANAARNITRTKIDIESPPTVTLEIVDMSKLPTVKLRVSAAARSQPITALDVFIDGVPAAGGHVDFQDGKNSVTKQPLTITLPGQKPTPYSLTAMASTKDQYGFSENVEVAHIDVTKLPSLHVLSVGINAYQAKTLTLEYARTDAEAILKNFNHGAGGGLFKKVNGKSLLDKQATSKAILAELEQLQKAVDENDLVVVFFAGHGVKDSTDFYLLTEESQSKDLAGTALSGTTLRQKLGGFRCQVLLLLDACHSGAFGDAAALRPASDDAVRNLGSVDVRVAVLTAARGYEKAQARNGRGLFTDAIVRALNKEKGVPFNVHDNMLYIDHLATYTLYEVQKASGGEQHPYLELPRMVLPFPIMRFAKAG